MEAIALVAACVLASSVLLPEPGRAARAQCLQMYAHKQALIARGRGVQISTGQQTCQSVRR